MQTRSRAIGTALTNYNRLAKTLEPPREDLNFQEILHYSSLAEFDLLRDTRNTVQNHIWTQPKYRAAMAAYYKVQCAHSEIKRANIEITRLRTFIRDDTALHLTVIDSLHISNPGLSAVLAHRWELQSAVNDVHLRRLNSVANLPGYTGGQGCGVRVGSLSVAHDLGQGRAVGSLEEEEEEDIDDDVFQDSLNTLTDYITTLDLVS